MPENNSKKAIAVYLSPLKADLAGFHDNKQVPLKLRAEELDIAIVSFLAISPKAKRRGLEQALVFGQTLGAQYLILDESSILFLPTLEQGQILAGLSQAGISICLVNPKVCLEATCLHTWAELFMGGLKASSVAHSRQIKKGLAKRKKQGHPMGARPYGSNEGEVLALQEMLELTQKGMSLQKICDHLNRQNIQTVQQKTWYPTTIKRLLSRIRKNQSALEETFSESAPTT
jgi:hypothetical protein